MKRIIISVVILAIHAGLLFPQSHFSKIWSGFGLDQMNFYVTSATINGDNLQNGDEVAVFDGGNCVGVILVTGSGMLSIVASKDDPVTPGVVDGFREGNMATFKIWDASRGTEVSDITVNLSGGSLVFEASGSAFVSLTGSATCTPPPAPGVGIRIHPTCSVPTGSVSLYGLPATGTWTLKRIPGGNTYAGTGTNTTISDLAPGIYNFTVTNSFGCTSAQSENVVINAQQASPAAPGVGVRTHPTCTVPTGSVSFYGLPATGTWTLKMIPGGNTYTGTGTHTTITGLVSGIYNFTVTNSSGCTSAQSENVVINTQPASPSAPVAGVRTHPTCSVPTGSVNLYGLPAAGTWTLKMIPGGTTYTGTGSNTTVTDLAPGIYNFIVTNADGCTSDESDNVVINANPSAPAVPTVGTVTQPSCEVTTGSVELGSLPAGNWIINPGSISGSGPSTILSGLKEGIHNFSVTNATGCISGISENIVINKQPETPSAPIIGTIMHPTCDDPVGSIALSGLPVPGTWNLSNITLGTQVSGTGANKTIEDLPAGSYTFKVAAETGCISAISAMASLNDVPSITGQKIITVEEDNSVKITIDHLVIQDSDNQPDQMSLVVGTGDNYTVSADNTIIPSDNYYGKLVVPVTVNDGIAVSHSFNASVTVTPVNDKPVIGNIPDQIIDQDSVFASILLGDYIEDVETPDNHINWTFTVNDTLQVTIADQIATITSPGTDWTGNDTIIFTATDDDPLNPLSSMDTVYFTIKPSIATGDPDKEQLSALVYPNPVKEVMHIVFSEQLKDKDISVEIINMQGTVIYNSRNRIVNNRIDLDMKNVISGTLLIRIISARAIKVFQIIKK